MESFECFYDVFFGALKCCVLYIGMKCCFSWKNLCLSEEVNHIVFHKQWEWKSFSSTWAWVFCLCLLGAAWHGPVMERSNSLWRCCYMLDSLLLFWLPVCSLCDCDTHLAEGFHVPSAWTKLCPTTERSKRLSSPDVISVWFHIRVMSAVSVHRKFSGV